MLCIDQVVELTVFEAGRLVNSLRDVIDLHRIYCHHIEVLRRTI